MSSTEPNNKTVAEAIEALEAELAKMKSHPRGELGNMDPDTAFESGYAACIFDLKHALGPAPAERVEQIRQEHS